MVSLVASCVGFFIKSKIVCVGRLGETQEFTLSGRRSAAGKKGKCVLSSAKIKLLFRITEIRGRKIVVIFEKTEVEIKTSGLFLECRPLSSASSLYFEKRWVFSCPRFGVLFYLSRVGTPKRTRACTSRTQQVRNSCLHPSHSPVMG